MIRQILSAGQRIGDRYEIRRLLGSGGMADVYLARDSRLMRDIALKILRLDQALDDLQAAGQKERLLREARAAARLNHPGIVVIHDLGESGNYPFISMEYIEGRNLRDLQHHFLAQGSTMPLEDILHIVRQVAAALDYAHEQGVIHRDIKPENIMITPDGTCKITDFGIARSQVAGLRTLTPHGKLACTFHYAAPEYFRREPANTRGDQFSFGCVLYELLTGRFAFAGEEEHQVWYSITQVNPVPPGDLVFDLPETVNPVVLHMLAKYPDERFPSCRDAVAALENALAGLPGGMVFRLSKPPDAESDTVTPCANGADPDTDGQQRMPPYTAAPIPGTAAETAGTAAQVIPGETTQVMPGQDGSGRRVNGLIAAHHRLVIAGLIVLAAAAVGLRMLRSGSDGVSMEPAAAAPTPAQTSARSPTASPIPSTPEPSYTPLTEHGASAAVLLDQTGSGSRPEVSSPIPVASTPAKKPVPGKKRAPATPSATETPVLVPATTAMTAPAATPSMTPAGSQIKGSTTGEAVTAMVAEPARIEPSATPSTGPDEQTEAATPGKQREPWVPF